MRDWAQVRGSGSIDEDTAAQALSFFEVDSLGLDSLDNKILELLCVSFGGRPVGLSTLSSALAEDSGYRRGCVRTVSYSAGPRSIADRLPAGLRQPIGLSNIWG